MGNTVNKIIILVGYKYTITKYKTNTHTFRYFHMVGVHIMRWEMIGHHCEG